MGNFIAFKSWIQKEKMLYFYELIHKTGDKHENIDD